MNNSLCVPSLLDLSHTIAKPLFDTITYPWEALPHIGAFILALGKALPESEYEQRGEHIWVSRQAIVYPSVHISGPCIIDHGAEIRHCAFIRGNAIVGKGAVVGNSTELKNAILFDSAQVPHFNYVGDSILGYKAHMGAGAITSNVKSDKTLVAVHYGGQMIETGLKKFGTILGDFVEIGCNGVLSPGSIVGRGSTVYPTVLVRGVVPEKSILKSTRDIVPKRD